MLQPNGLFFHFGPLHYHFNEIEEMLTAEEIKDAFKAEGFEIITEDLEDLTHHHSEVSLSVKKYYNWIFAVRKKEVPVIKVHPDVILKMDKGFDYRATGNINSSSKGEEMKYQILLPSGQKFSGSELILEISRRVDGEKSLNTIITEIESEFDFQIDNQQDLLELIQQLTEGEVFKV